MSGQVIGSLKHALNGVYSGGTPTAGDDSFYSDDGDPFVTIGDMSSQFPITSTLRRVTPLGVQDKNLRKVKSGTVLVSMYATIGLPNILATDAYINQAILALTPSQNVDSRFLYYWLMHLRPSLVSTVSGSTQGNLNAEKVKNADFPFLELPTQKAIADFLDRETARIDQLIEKKQRFLELVQEKKATLLVDSSNGSILGETMIERDDWIGEIPKSWVVTRIKRLFKERDERSISGDEELLTVSHITGVTRRSEKDVNMFMAESHVGYKIVRPDDVVVNTMWGWMGAMGVSQEFGIVSPSYGVYEPLVADKFDFNYLDRLLRSSSFVAEVTRRSKGIHSSRLRIYPEAFLDILIPIPTLGQQKRAVEAYESEAQEEQIIEQLTLRAIELLRDRRSSLISTSVTGQFDVCQRVESNHIAEVIERETGGSR